MIAYDNRDQNLIEDNIDGSAQRDDTGCTQKRTASDVPYHMRNVDEFSDADALENINCIPYQDRGATKDVAGSALESNTDERQQQQHTSSDNAPEIDESHNNIDQGVVGQTPRNSSIISKCGETDAANDTTGSVTDDVEDCITAEDTAGIIPVPHSITSSDETAQELTPVVTGCAADGPIETVTKTVKKKPILDSDSKPDSLFHQMSNKKTDRVNVRK